MNPHDPPSLRRVADGSHTAAAGDDLWCSTDAGPAVITPPADPQHGDAFGVMRFGRHDVLILACDRVIGAKVADLRVDGDGLGAWCVWDAVRGSWAVAGRKAL